MARGHVGRRTKSRPNKTKVRKPSGATLGVSPYFYYTLLLVVIVFFALVRFRLRDMPLERDEGEYAYGGQLLLQGISLYNRLYTVKLPGTHVAYAVILALIGQTPSRIHMGLILVNAATTLLVFLLCARVFGRLAGLVAAASYGLLSISPITEGFAAHATHFVLLFAIAGTWLLLEALDANRIWLVFCAGLLFGLAYLMKQPGVLFLLWAVLYLLSRRQARPINWKSLPMQLGALLLGGTLPFAATCLLIWRAGTFRKFWFWTFLYAREYGTNTKLRDGLEHFQKADVSVVGAAVWIWSIAALGLTAFLWSARARSNAFFSSTFLLFSFLAICPGLYFRPHYFILMLPAVSMLAGMGVSCGTETLLNWKGLRALSAIPVLIFLVAFSSALYQQREFFFEMNPVEACRKHYGHNPFPEALVVSDYIRNNTSPNAAIAVLGSEPEIYFYSHRLSATGYIYTYPLLEPGKYAVAMQKEMEAEIEKSQPEMLVLVNEPKSWVAFVNIAAADEILRWANTYAKQHYVVDGVAEMGKYSTDYYWGEKARNHLPSTALNIIVLKRKSA